MLTWRSIVGLLLLQLRMLLRNRSACALVLMLIVAAAFLGRSTIDDVEDICYVLYWQEDDWIRHLRTALPDDGPLRIELAKACDFTNEHGLITYPLGAHSIQIRPPETDTEPWRIWYWYSGNQPEVLQPAIRWFWQASREFFQQQLPLEVRVSALEPIHPFTASTKLATRQMFNRRHARQMVLLASLFFCAAYLPALSFADQLDQRVLDTVFTKPIGSQGWALTVFLFHWLLTMAVALLILLLYGWLASSKVWVGVLLGAFSYLGLSLAIGCWCKHAAAASSSITVYGIMSGAILAIGVLVPQLAPEQISQEWGLIELFSHPHLPLALSSLSPFVVWSIIWWTIGSAAFYRCVTHR